MPIDPRQVILVVEDSEEHYEAVLRAFRKTEIPNPVHRCEDGDEALDYLFHRGRYSEYSSSPRPAVVLLDLNLPGTDGREVLDAIKRNESLRSLPVVVLTTSSNPSDIQLCYRTGAASYIIKPISFSDFLKTIETLKSYWFDTVALPVE
ncbi:MAG TPA: response regulator [Pirellulales bacterium]